MLMPCANAVMIHTRCGIDPSLNEEVLIFVHADVLDRTVVVVVIIPQTTASTLKHVQVVLGAHIVLTIQEEQITLNNLLLVIDREDIREAAVRVHLSADECSRSNVLSMPSQDS